MRRGVCCVALVMLLMCSVSGNVAADETGKYQKISRIGFIKNNGSNVRAGDNINFEILCKLEKDDPVKVVGKRYSWYKIILPQKASVFIKSDFVTLSPEEPDTGQVNATRVNLRAGPGTRYSILGQVSYPQKVKIKSEKEGWYKISPPRGLTGWVHKSQLRFSLQEERSSPEADEATN